MVRSFSVGLGLVHRTIGMVGRRVDGELFEAAATIGIDDNVHRAARDDQQFALGNSAYFAVKNGVGCTLDDPQN